MIITPNIIEKEIPKKIKDDFQITNTIIKGSVGKGDHTPYPWIGIFDKRVSSGATNGFYIVMLFSDEYDCFYLTLNQGSTVQNKESIKQNTDFVFSTINKINGFTKGALPKGSLVKRLPYKSNNKGKLYEETNLFYKKYDIDSMNDRDFIQDLNKLLKAYGQCCTKYSSIQNNNKPFSASAVIAMIKRTNLIFSSSTVKRFSFSLISKPFLILTGLSGSGKTKLAQVFVKWMCESQDQYLIVPVGADWTNREPLLGYPNALERGKYCEPDNGILNIIIEASKTENSKKPYFIILDEMNLSHVERYFADFLSAMESEEGIPLHSLGRAVSESEKEIPEKIRIPENLYVIGTVNVDETTYMFSPKVLDRANVIEFQISADDIQAFLENPVKPDLDKIEALGLDMASDFVNLSQHPYKDFTGLEDLKNVIPRLFEILRDDGFEFGYRTISEIWRFCAVYKSLDDNTPVNEMIDFAILQKILPKLHGSRKKLIPVLDNLIDCCVTGNDKKGYLMKLKEENRFPENDGTDADLLYPNTLEKLLRMRKRVIQDGFTSFAEA